MAKKYLIDTSAVIKYLNQSFPINAIDFIDKIIDDESNISFISAIELQVWNPTNNDDLLIYEEFVKASNVFKIDDDIIHQQSV